MVRSGARLTIIAVGLTCLGLVASEPTLPPPEKAHRSDMLSHKPSNYSTFKPPAAEGGWYVDPMFGTRVRRLSVASEHLSPWSGRPWGLVGNEWASVNAVNVDNSKVLLQTGGPATVWSALGRLLSQLNYDFTVSALQYRWSHSDAN